MALFEELGSAHPGMDPLKLSFQNPFLNSELILGWQLKGKLSLFPSPANIYGKLVPAVQSYTLPTSFSVELKN